MTTATEVKPVPAKYRTDFEAQYDVQFSDPDKAESYYVNGEFAKHITRNDDLKEVAKMFAQQFINTESNYDSKMECRKKYLVDIGDFYLRDGRWVSSEDLTEEGGEIVIVEEQELDAFGTYKV